MEIARTVFGSRAFTSLLFSYYLRASNLNRLFKEAGQHVHVLSCHPLTNKYAPPRTTTVLAVKRNREAAFFRRMLSSAFTPGRESCLLLL